MKNDYFSKQSVEYAKYRQRYPEALFEYLATLTPHHQCALDVATGNGQAAIGLAKHYDRVIALDQSSSQISEAFPHPRVTYRVGRAQGLHWLDLEAFYREVKRLLKPQGILAAWMYNLPQIAPTVDAVVRKLHDDILKSYWPPERKLVTDGYRSIHFPFSSLSAPSFVLRVHWTLEDLLGYLSSWSATRRYIETRKDNPVEFVVHDLDVTWGDVHTHLVSWPLTVRIGAVADFL